MTEQEKEDLIAECRRTINAGTQLQSTYREIALAKISRIALTSLTAQPVKLPALISSWEGNEVISGRNGGIADCAKALRQQGYEVEE